MNQTLKILIIVVLLVLIGAVVYTKSQKEESDKKIHDTTMVTPTGTTMSPTMVMSPTVATTPEVSGAMSDTTVKTVNVEAGSFYYKPNEIRVKKGDKVKIVMNAVSMMHDFNIDELNVKMPIVKNGDTGTVEFTADKAGTFEYYCSVGQHRSMGQIGKLIVE